MTETKMKKALVYLTASLGGLFCAMGADCLPDPPPPPKSGPCTAADIPGDCEGGRIIGSRAAGTCACMNTGGSTPISPPNGGSGVIKMTLASGWSFGGYAGGVPTVSLTGEDMEGAVVASPALPVTDTEFSNGRVDFAFDGLGAGFHSVAGMAQPAVHVRWNGPATLTLTNPGGATVDAALPEWVLLPVSIHDDCETLTFEGEVEQGPVTVQFKTQTESPGCD